MGVAAAAWTAAPIAGQPVTPARSAASALPQLHGLLVSHRGQIVLRSYAKGYSAGRLANIKSASKSIIAALVGIAIDRGLIGGVQEPIVRWFPELRTNGDPRRAAITIEDLLTMRSGLESTSGANYGRWVSSANWVRFALERPLVSNPGTSMEYSTGTSHLLSAILTKASGKTTHQFATDVLAKPLGITLARWSRDPQGIYFGGNEMLMTPRQMITIGELWLHRGRANGAQVVPAAWVETSCQPRTRSRWDSDRLRVRLVEPDVQRAPLLLRVGLRWPVHLRVQRSGVGGRGDVRDDSQRRAAGLSAPALRSAARPTCSRTLPTAEAVPAAGRILRLAVHSHDL